MLLRNGLSSNVLPLSLTGAGWQNFVHDTAAMNQANAEAFSKLSAYSTGLYFPHCMVPPRTAGRMAAHDTLTGTGTVSNANAWAVKLAEAMLTGSGTLSATGSLIVQLLAAIAGSGTVSSANVQAFLSAVASLTGTGGVTAAALTGIGELLADLLGDGTLDDSILTAIGELTADLVVTGTGLSTANVGQAVWSALAAANNVSATMGEKLNDAGSASNPWTEVIEAGYTAAEILRILAAHAAGAATGLEGANPQFTGIDGTTLRIDGTYSAGTRTIDSLDGS